MMNNNIKNVEIKFKKLDSNAIIPTFGSKDAAGFDFYSIEEYLLKSYEQKLIKTGLSVEIPKGYEMQIRPRSGLALKYKITVLNAPGTIDSDYRGEIMILLINFGKPFKIHKHARIAQGVIQKLPKIEIKEVESLSESQRNKGGFGSTGL